MAFQGPYSRPFKINNYYLFFPNKYSLKKSNEGASKVFLKIN
jgi:hypothetical protein